MKLTTLHVGTLGVAGLVTTGLLAFPIGAATAGSDDQGLKRDDDTPDVVLVADDDDDDTGLGKRDGTHTNTSGGTHTRTGGTHSRDQTRTGRDSGRDHSRDRVGMDWTSDGAGNNRVDWSQNRTNDRSRHNTRG
ncbi:hypothetical protein [Nocardioides sp. cx-173]|uniref:hypothetical protein n=1 Tax=Nocardioides sp. cx-173 TaxID=2898796 RepID=UPI001E4A51C6|nr:hypothetical protein [Nocardioides sp. cx-173]MCD4527248.1 hypothetical protein [Nocardioides sp. cx-173]UGB40375.1 hypothetical protein LQ940_13385 [Nocardioides sp. cx-173]